MTLLDPVTLTRLITGVFRIIIFTWMIKHHVE